MQKIKSKETEVLENFLNDINQELEEETESEIDLSNFFNNIIDDDIEKFDSFEAYTDYKYFMIEEAKKEVVFKRRARKYSLIALGVVSILMIINILIMLYGADKKIYKEYRIPNFDHKLVLAMITATFVNLFAIITLVFKYVFSPTSDILNHTKEINGG